MIYIEINVFEIELIVEMAILAMLKIYLSKVEQLVINFIFEHHCLLALPNGIKEVILSIKISVFKTRPEIDQGVGSKIEVEPIDL